MLGILALHACLRELTLKEQQRRLAHEMGLLRRLYDGLSALSGITVYGGRDMERQVPLLSCTLEGMVAADVGAILDGDFEICRPYGIALRASGARKSGHCAARIRPVQPGKSKYTRTD